MRKIEKAKALLQALALFSTGNHNEFHIILPVVSHYSPCKSCEKKRYLVFSVSLFDSPHSEVSFLFTLLPFSIGTGLLHWLHDHLTDAHCGEDARHDDYENYCCGHDFPFVLCLIIRYVICVTGQF